MGLQCMRSTLLGNRMLRHTQSVSACAYLPHHSGSATFDDVNAEQKSRTSGVLTLLFLSKCYLVLGILQ